MKMAEHGILHLKEARRLAAELMKDYVGRMPERVVHQASGLSNFVFLARVRKEEFVVRIAPDGARLDAFVKERWAVKKVRQHGIPTPEILEVGHKVIPFPYMISRKVRGQEATYHRERIKILEELGRYAARINAVGTHGYGSVFDWAGRGRPKHTTWMGFLEGELNLELRLESLERHGGLSRIKTETIRSFLLAAADENPSPALNHSDLRLKNVIVDEKGAIIAILDWENCISSVAPQWELSLALHDLSIDETQAFLRGYGLRPREVQSLAPAIKAMNLINYARELEGLAHRGDQAKLEEYRLRLTGALDLYSL